ncbi:HrpB1 family type III secretion system apparatus protein [Burkholderia anthina]|nr:HrpB1 family type III secretion system apparatus protein [Burkholderia anthina]
MEKNMIEALSDNAIVTGMMHVLWAGAALDTFSDVQDLLDAMAVLRPGNGEMREVLAWWHVRARAWGEALTELRRVERDGTLSSRGMALAAVCLYALGDASWRTYAYAAAYKSDDPMATRTAQALLAAPAIGRG